MGRRFVYTYAPPTTVSLVYNGYFFGGYNGSTTVVTADKLVFTTATMAAQSSANLSAARSNGTCISDKTTYGYITLNTTNGDRITFATDTTAADTNTKLFTNTTSELVSLSDGSLYGYFIGGWTGAARNNKIDRIVFSTGINAANAQILSQARSSIFTLSDGATYGYASGGYGSSGDVDTSDRCTFSTSVWAANTSSKTSIAKRSIGGGMNATTYGYMCGGSTSDQITAIDKLTYSTSTNASSSITLTVKRDIAQAVSNKSTIGYICGGYIGSVTATNNSLTYSTETTATVASADLSVGRYQLSGCANFAI